MDEYKEFIIPINDTALDYDEMFIGIIRKQKELIRCKDCKYWLPHSQFGFDEDNEEYHDYCKRLVPDDDYYAFTRNADDFCSRAKRKEE